MPPTYLDEFLFSIEIACFKLMLSACDYTLLYAASINIDAYYKLWNNEEDDSFRFLIRNLLVTISVDDVKVNIPGVKIFFYVDYFMLHNKSDNLYLLKITWQL